MSEPPPKDPASSERSADRRVEPDLRTSEGRYRSVFDNATDGTFILDDQGVVLTANPAAQTMFGTSELVGLSIDELIPTWREAEHADLDADRELVGERLDGTRFPLRLTVRLATGPDPLIHAFVKDLTRRNALRAEVDHAHKAEVIAAFTSSLAHDYNNLLMGIVGCLDLALQTVEGATAGNLAQARDAALRGSALTRQLLTLGRREVAAAGEVCLDNVLRDARPLLESLVGAGVAVELRLAAADACLAGDVGQIEQLIFNLAANARDAMPGGGTLVVATRVVAEPGGERVVVSIEDDGAGMDAETLERAFEPGFTTKGLGVGSGLGLASVRRIVEGSGGKLSLTSTLGKGTSVHLAWPRVIPAERRSTVVDREAPLVSRRGVALVIDDEPLIRLTVRSYLESFGYSVLEARDAMTTAEVLEANDRPLRLVISDVVIPGTSAVADVVARYPDVPILYMSGHGADWLVEHGYLPRGEELLAKPFTRAQLHARLATRLGAHLQLPATVLLVEDDELSRQAISELLTTDGYRVVGASKGRDALETCEREKLQIDAVVTDLGLPDMSGQRLSQHLRARFESCPVVFLSGQPRGAPQVQDAIAAPRTAFLQKPVQVTELITVIEELLRAP